MKKMIFRFSIIFCSLVLVSNVYSQKLAIEEKLTRIEERLIRLEEGQKAINQRIDILQTQFYFLYILSCCNYCFDWCHGECRNKIYKRRETNWTT